MQFFAHMYQSMRRLSVSLGIAVALLAAAPAGVQAQNAGDLNARNEQIAQLAGEGDFAQAAALTVDKLATAERVLGKEHPSTFAIANDLAELYLAHGQVVKASQVLKGILEAQERVLGKGHPDTFRTVKNTAIGWDGKMWERVREAPANIQAEWAKEIEVRNAQVLQFMRRGRPYAARSLALQTQQFADRLLSKDHPAALTAVNNEIALFLELGEYGNAVTSSEIALETAGRMLGGEHLQTLRSMSNLAQASSMIAINAMSRSGKLNSLAAEYIAKAEPLFKRALEAQERLLGKEHPDTLLTIDRLAGLYAAQPSRSGEAEPLYKFALETRERLLGKEHPDTLNSVNGLAELYRVQERYGEAEPLYRRALETRERVLGRDHPDTLRSVSGLGEWYRAQGRYAEAEPLLKRALEARGRVFGPMGAIANETLVSAFNLVELYRAQGRLGEAEPLLQRLHPGTRGATQ
jgi:tetratricopeptide (TPR) repeat protein